MQSFLIVIKLQECIAVELDAEVFRSNNLPSVCVVGSLGPLSENFYIHEALAGGNSWFVPTGMVNNISFSFPYSNELRVKEPLQFLAIPLFTANRGKILKVTILLQTRKHSY